MRVEDIPPDGLYWVRTFGTGMQPCRVHRWGPLREVSVWRIGSDCEIDPDGIVEFGPKLEPPTCVSGDLMVCDMCGRRAAETDTGICLVCQPEALLVESP